MSVINLNKDFPQFPQFIAEAQKKYPAVNVMDAIRSCNDKKWTMVKPSLIDADGQPYERLLSIQMAKILEEAIKSQVAPVVQPVAPPTPIVQQVAPPTPPIVQPAPIVQTRVIAKQESSTKCMLISALAVAATAVSAGLFFAYRN